MPDLDKYTKDDCDYGPGDWPYECSTCAHASISESATNPKNDPNYMKRYGDRFLTWRAQKAWNRGTCRIVIGQIIGTDLCKFHVFAKGKESLEGE